MAHYHPVSYETEARIRQTEKLAHAHRDRQAHAARSGRPQPRPGRSLLSNARHILATVARALTPLAQEGKG